MPLNHSDKRILERLLGMSSGYVLDFTDRTFREFFEDHGIHIYDDDNNYNMYGTSKAKRMRAFWYESSDDTIAIILTSLLRLMKGCEEEISPIISRLQNQDIIHPLNINKNNVKSSSNNNIVKSPSNKIQTKSIHQSTITQIIPNMQGNGNIYNITYNLDKNSSQKEIFDIANKLAESIENNGAILKSIDDMKTTANTPSYNDRYNEFMSSIANHLTVFAPILPSLLQYLTK